MAIISWPAGLAPRRVDLRPINQTRSANKSISGFTQVADSITGRWGYTLEFNTLKRLQVLPYRALLAQLEGRGNVVRVPVFDRQLFPTDAEIAATISGTKGDATANVNLAVLPGASGKLFAGHYFGAGEDLHIIKTINWAGSTASLTFWPPFRSTKSNAAFKLRPTLLCRLTDDAIGNHPLELSIRTAPTLDFEEAPAE